MKCGVKFCGGCNPRYQRGEALKEIKEHFEGRIEFSYAEEGKEYDILLVIGGCTNCCASYTEYHSKSGILRMWDKSMINKIIDDLEKLNTSIV